MKELGKQAPDFSLPGVDGKTYSLKSFSNQKFLVVVFMCNHCPYVIAVQERINNLAREYQTKGIGFIGINPNDSKRYPDDNFEAMKKRSQEVGYVFPYVQDEDQSIAKAYDAVCTPDFFVYENKGADQFILNYRGRLDDSWKDPALVTRQELKQALDLMLNKKPIPSDQRPSMGCSIKWKN